MMLVFDATPLIYLSKTDILRILTQLNMKMVIPNSVYHEVVTKGKEGGYADSLKIERAVSDGIFELCDVEEGYVHNRLKGMLNLSRADIDVLELAKKKEAVAIADDFYVRDIAETQKIETRGTIYLVFEFLKNNLVSKNGSKEIVDSMIEEGWYCSTDLYKSIIKKIDE